MAVSPPTSDHPLSIAAAVVTGIREAGGTIAAKAACAHRCFAGASPGNPCGPIRTPHRPSRSAEGTQIAAPGRPRVECIRIALDMRTNTCPFDVTGHPAVTFPAAVQDGLPVGRMALGRQFDETSLIRIAEAARDRRPH